MSRILAVHTSYSAPVSAWKHLGRVESEGWAAGQPPYNVCVGKEWHRYKIVIFFPWILSFQLFLRFPSSFFLPSPDWEFKYLRSEFRGQLPQPFLKEDPEDPYKATSAVREGFNDENK